MIFTDGKCTTEETFEEETNKFLITIHSIIYIFVFIRGFYYFHIFKVKLLQFPHFNKSHVIFPHLNISIIKWFFIYTQSENRIPENYSPNLKLWPSTVRSCTVTLKEVKEVEILEKRSILQFAPQNSKVRKF